MSTADRTAPAQLLVPQAEFAGARFWSAAGRLAGGLGHGDHLRCLVGQVEPTNRYELRCMPCDEVLAIMLVQRADATGGPEGC